MIVNAVELPHLITRSCLDLHRDLGHGLPEWVYRDCLSRELRDRELYFKRDIPWSDSGRKDPEVFDFVIENSVAIMIRNGFEFARKGKIALSRELEDAGLMTGLVFNFNELDLRKGIHRVVREVKKADSWL